MKNPIELIRPLPKEVIQVGAFACSVLLGVIYKVIRQSDSGVKFTFRKYLAEAFTSFFIALIVYAIFDQFLHFNMLFTCMMCSLAGSMSSLFHKKIEDFIGYLFETAKKVISIKTDKP